MANLEKKMYEIRQHCWLFGLKLINVTPRKSIVAYILTTQSAKSLLLSIFCFLFFVGLAACSTLAPRRECESSRAPWAAPACAVLRWPSARAGPCSTRIAPHCAAAHTASRTGSGGAGGLREKEDTTDGLSDFKLN